MVGGAIGDSEGRGTVFSLLGFGNAGEFAA